MHIPFIKQRPYSTASLPVAVLCVESIRTYTPHKSLTRKNPKPYTGPPFPPHRHGARAGLHFLSRRRLPSAVPREGRAVRAQRGLDGHPLLRLNATGSTRVDDGGCGCTERPLELEGKRRGTGMSIAALLGSFVGAICPRLVPILPFSAAN